MSNKVMTLVLTKEVTMRRKTKYFETVELEDVIKNSFQAVKRTVTKTRTFDNKFVSDPRLAITTLAKGITFFLSLQLKIVFYKYFTK